MTAPESAVDRARSRLRDARNGFRTRGGDIARSDGGQHAGGTDSAGAASVFPRSRTMKLLFSASGAAGVTALALLFVWRRPATALLLLRRAPLGMLLRAAVLRGLAARSAR